MKGPTRFAVMLSGTGRTLVNLCKAIEDGRLGGEIALVIASRECPGAERARGLGLEVRIVPGEIPSEVLDRLTSEYGVEWVVLAGYTRLVRIPDRLRGRAVNIHPALLPVFGGPGMYGRRVHEEVLASGATRSGCTVHLCDRDYDLGPIVGQHECEVLAGDTAESLAARVFELECELYPRVLGELFGGRVEPKRGGERTVGR